MGITGLFPLIRKHAPHAIEVVPLQSLSGLRIGLDMSIFVHKFWNAAISGIARDAKVKAELFDDGQCDLVPIRTPLSTAESLQEIKRTPVVSMIKQLTRIMDLGVRPVCVFDGKPPKSKEECLAVRHADISQDVDGNLLLHLTRDIALSTLGKEMMAADDDGAVATPSKKLCVDPEVWSNIKEYVALSGIPYVKSNGEADPQLAAQCKAGIIDAVWSEDADLLTFGTPVLYCKYDSKTDNITRIELSKVLSGLELNQDEFVDLCILLGCDYSPKIKGIGPVGAYRHIKEKRRIEQVILAPKVKVGGDFRYETAREEFAQIRILAPHSRGLFDPTLMRSFFDLKGYSPRDRDQACKILARMQKSE